MLLAELEELIVADPTAYWDEATKSIKGSVFDVTPRLLAVSCFDPRCPPTSARQYVEVTKIAVVFLESTTGPTTIRVRFVDHASEILVTTDTTWGQIKGKFGEQE